MVCVNCNSETRVINSRIQKRSNQVWRRRRCVMCGLVFSTEENVLYQHVWLVSNPNGGYSPFSAQKLFMSLYESCQHRSSAVVDATELSRTLIKKLQPRFKDGLISSQTITQVAQVALNRFDKAASVSYEAHHRLKKPA